MTIDFAVCDAVGEKALCPEIVLHLFKIPQELYEAQCIACCRSYKTQSGYYCERNKATDVFSLRDKKRGV